MMVITVVTAMQNGNDHNITDGNNNDAKLPELMNMMMVIATAILPSSHDELLTVAQH